MKSSCHLQKRRSDIYVEIHAIAGLPISLVNRVKYLINHFLFNQDVYL